MHIFVIVRFPQGGVQFLQKEARGGIAFARAIQGDKSTAVYGLADEVFKFFHKIRLLMLGLAPAMHGTHHLQQPKNNAKYTRQNDQSNHRCQPRAKGTVQGVTRFQQIHTQDLH